MIRRLLKWSAQIVIKKIQQLHRKRKYLNHRYVKKGKYAKLFNAAYRYFGGWRQAVEAAGIDYSKNVKKTRDAYKWTRQKIIKAIKKRRKEGKALNYAAVMRDDASLWHASRYYFDNGWRGAVEAAGYKYGRVVQHPMWNKEKLIKKIKSLYRQKKSLKPDVNKTLYAAACRHFGNYKNAVEAAGIPYAELNLRRKWTIPKIKKQLLKRFREKKPMNAGSLHQDDPGMYAVARQYFGGYDKALEAIGLDVRKVRKIPASLALVNWAKSLSDDDLERLSQKIRALHSNGGRDDQEAESQ